MKLFRIIIALVSLGCSSGSVLAAIPVSINYQSGTSDQKQAEINFNNTYTINKEELKDRKAAISMDGTMYKRTFSVPCVNSSWEARIPLVAIYSDNKTGKKCSYKTSCRILGGRKDVERTLHDGSACTQKDDSILLK
jgi:hypothetical protein